MPGTLWAIAETGPDGHLTKLSAEVATLVRGLGAAAGRDVAGLVTGAPGAVSAVAAELASYLPRVVAVEAATAASTPFASLASAGAVQAIGSDSDASVFIGNSPDGRDIAGFLMAALGSGVISNAAGIAWDGGPVAEKGVFGGRLLTTSSFADGHGIVTVPLGSVPAEAAASAGTVETVALADAASAVTVLERVSEAAGAVQIEEAKIIVSGGRGVGGPDGFAIVGELAEVLGGAVAASRAAVDAGWIPYARQVGQTGKIVKPEVYIALGISGAVQHKVGMQGAHTIVAVNTDPDAPIAEFADMFVIGNLFEIVPALVAELKAHKA
jgi:electron transfer flavoprotein alpha subunit